MSQEVFEIVQTLNPKALETQMVLQCAPMIAGLKVSNLLIICDESADFVKKMLRGTRISCDLLQGKNGKTTLLLYRKKELREYVSQKKVKSLLHTLGYGDETMDSILKAVGEKYRRYCEGQGDFPHELGLLLGYPPEDVLGYLENHGRNALCTGYWQVYENAPAKKDLFQKFEQAKETLVQMICEGMQIPQIIRWYDSPLLPENANII